MFNKIIVVLGMPRSGTSWLGTIIDSCPSVRYRLSPLFSYPLKNCVDEQSSREDWQEMWEKAFLSDDDFMCQTKFRSEGYYPAFEFKSSDPDVLAIKMNRFHNLLRTMLEYFSENDKMISIVRHPCGAINSWLSSKKEFPENADPLTEWRTGACRKTSREEFWGFDDWISVTKLHLLLQDLYPDNFKIIRYEDLVENPVELTKQIFSFTQIPFTEQTETFLQDCHSKHDGHTHAVFKSPEVKDKWREELEIGIQREIFNSLKGTELERFTL